MPANRAHFVDHREAHGEALFAKVSELDFEGIVAKQSNSVYTAGRRPEWMKMKNPNYCGARR
jgi:ATP-dependent DNA ligase